MKKCLFLLVSALCFLLLFCPSSKAASNTDLENQIKILSQKGALPSNAYTNYMNSPYKTDVTDYNYMLFITASNNYRFADKFCICRIRSNSEYIWEYNNYWRVAPFDAFDFNFYNLNLSSQASNTNGGGYNIKQTKFVWLWSPIPINTSNMTLGANEEFGGPYLSGPSLVFTPATTKTINITANGVTESFYNLQNSRNINYWRLGSIQGALDVSAVELNLRCIC